MSIVHDIGFSGISCLGAEDVWPDENPSENVVSVALTYGLRN